MRASWRDTITDPTECKIFEALEDPRWDFRTVPGLSKTLGIPEDRVRDILRRYPHLVRQSPVPDSEGRDLFSLVSRGRNLREWYRITRAFVTKSTSV